MIQFPKTLESLRQRILFVITQSEYGGAQRFLHHLITHLDSKKYEMTIVTGQTAVNDLFGHTSQATIEESINGMKEIDQSPVKLIRLAGLNREIKPIADIKSAIALRRLIGKLKPEVLFLLSSKAGFLGALAANFPSRFKNLKIIYRIGGWSFNDPWPWWKKHLFLFLERRSVGWKDIIVVNNQSDFSQAKKIDLKPKEKLVMIANGLDIYKLNLLSPAEAKIRLFEKISKETGKIFQTKTLVGTIANFYPAKGLEYLIETARLLTYHFSPPTSNPPFPACRFIIIGDGPQRPKLERLIHQYGLEKTVFLVGQIPDAYRFLPAFDIFTLTSVKEGFPWSLLEAMAAKIPVIATAVGAVPEIIEDGKNGILVEPKNPFSIAKKIKNLAQDDQLRQELAIQAHQTVLLKYDLGKMIRQIEELF